MLELHEFVFALGVRSEPMSEDELMKLEVLGAWLGRGDPLYEFVDLRREAMVQRQFDGNARMTVIASPPRAKCSRHDAAASALGGTHRSS